MLSDPVDRSFPGREGSTFGACACKVGHSRERPMVIPSAAQGGLLALLATGPGAAATAPGSLHFSGFLAVLIAHNESGAIQAERWTVVKEFLCQDGTVAPMTAADVAFSITKACIYVRT